MDNIKIFAIPVMGKSAEFKVSKLFARSPYFLVYDEKNGNIQFIKNDFKVDQIQSGKSISKILVARGVNVFCGHEIGFNVQKIAENNNIQLVILPNDKEMTAKEVLEIAKNRK